MAGKGVCAYPSITLWPPTPLDLLPQGALRPFSEAANHCASACVTCDPLVLGRCFHVFKVALEDGVPVVLAREHDCEASPWVGTPSGKGWPIFVDPDDIPKFSQVHWQARVPLHNFEDVKRRALQKMCCWKHQLEVCGDPAAAEPAKARKLRRMARAVKWWHHFIAMHEVTFPDGEAGAPSFHVDDGSKLTMDTLLPTAPSARLVATVPRASEQRAERTPFVARWAQGRALAHMCRCRAFSKWVAGS